MSEPKREPVTDPATGRTLQKDQPGYYPGFSTLSQQRYWDAATRKVVLKRLTTAQPIRFFSPEEAATMTAVLDRILPQEDRSPSRRIPLLPVLDSRLADDRIDGYRYEDMPSDRDAYRLAAQAFRQMAEEVHGRPFHEVETIEQEKLLQSVHAEEPAGAKDLWKRMSVKRFWSMLVSDACGAYYAHPWAWDEVGFGGPAYPRGYMRLEEGEPEPWEVNEQRYQWTAPTDTLSDTPAAQESKEGEQTRPGQGGTH